MPPARVLTAALLTAALAAPPVQAAELSVEILQYGEMRGRPAGEHDPALRDDTLSGVQPIARPSFASKGSSLVVRYCSGFGIMFQVRGLYPGELAVLQVRNTHPRLVRSDGASSTVDRFEVRVGTDPSWVGFTFAETWSLTPGRWTLALEHGGKVLAEQAFDIRVAADPGSLEANGCATPMS